MLLFSLFISLLIQFALIFHIVAKDSGFKSSITIDQAHASFDCETLLRPIRAKRAICQKESDHVVDICSVFSYDYEYLMPFLIHHLSIGFNKIRIYNNDDTGVSWYNHPAVTCLVAEELVTIQPWYGVGVMVRGINHCMKVIQRDYKDIYPIQKIWTFPADIDEYVVLHKEQCINKFVSTREAPGIALNWAFFIPELPYNNFSRTGSVRLRGSGNATCSRDICTPMDMVTTRWFENKHVKTIARVMCAETWHNVHYPHYKHPCENYGTKPVDPQGHQLVPDYFTPWVDNYYPEVQLNHYWTLSMLQFLRKIHRGIGDTDKSIDKYRSTIDLFTHQREKKFVVDTSFGKRYGEFFDYMKSTCPDCFRLDYFHLDYRVV